MWYFCHTRQFLYTYGPFEFTLLQLKFSTHPSSALILATPIAEIQGYIKYILMWIFIRFKVTK